MSPYDFVHLALLAMGGEIKGKTKLQKTVYFLGPLTDTVNDLGYCPHFYGPYAAEVAGAANLLRAVGFADQTVSGAGTIDKAGFEVARYDLCLNEEGKRMAQVKAEKHPEEWERMRTAAEVLKRSGDHDYVKLSIAAKTYFMLGQRKGLAQLQDLVSVANEFGWSVTPGQVREAAKLLESLGLVTLAKSSADKRTA